MSFFDDLGENAAPRPGRDRPGGRVAWWTIVLVVVLVAAAYAALVWFAEDLAPRRATVQGVDIGGQTRTGAIATLRAELGPRMSEPVLLTHRGKEVRILPAEAGISIDYAATVRRAGAGQTRTPRELWDHYTGDSDTAAVLRVDEAAMSRVLDDVTGRFNSLAVEGTVDFSTGRARPVYGTPGQQVDRDATVELVKQTIFDPAEAELPVEDRAPYITGAAVQEALAGFGRPAMSAPVTVLIGPHRVVMPPKVVGPALTMIPGSGKLTPRLDVRRLLDLLAPRMTAIGDKPRNASVRVVDGTLVTTRARIGAAWDDTELEQGVLEALVKKPGQRSFRLQAAITLPDVKDAAVEAWGIRERVERATIVPESGTEATREAVAALDNRRIPAGKSLTIDADVPEVSRAVLAMAKRFGMAVEGQVISNPGPHSVLVSAMRRGDTVEVSLWGTSGDRRDPPRTPQPSDQ